MGCGSSKAVVVEAAPRIQPAVSKPQVIFVLGGPGSGKGTQCSRIVEKFGFRHISAGDCLREERSQEGSEYKKLIDEYIANGLIVPVEITVSLLEKKMHSLGTAVPFLIDGFPRNLDNLEGWRSKLGHSVEVLGCLFIDCSEEEMERRLLKRGETSGRTDDNAASILKRFGVYRNETMPIIEDFKSKDLLYAVNGDRDLEAVWEDVEESINNAYKKN